MRFSSPIERLLSSCRSSRSSIGSIAPIRHQIRSVPFFRRGARRPRHVPDSMRRRRCYRVRREMDQPKLADDFRPDARRPVHGRRIVAAEAIAQTLSRMVRSAASRYGVRLLGRANPNRPRTGLIKEKRAGTRRVFFHQNRSLKSPHPPAKARTHSAHIRGVRSSTPRLTHSRASSGRFRRRVVRWSRSRRSRRRN